MNSPHGINFMLCSAHTLPNQPSICSLWQLLYIYNNLQTFSLELHSLAHSCILIFSFFLYTSHLKFYFNFFGLMRHNRRRLQCCSDIATSSTKFIYFIQGLCHNLNHISTDQVRQRNYCIFLMSLLSKYHLHFQLGSSGFEQNRPHKNFD